MSPDPAHAEPPPAAASTRRRPSVLPSIPGYRVDKEIGRGAMGIVFHARQTIVDREVALKVLHPEHSSSPKLVRRLQREARTTARLAHPHVVTAIDMGETEGSWWYAMEYVDGPSLAERLAAEGRLSERTALRLFIPLCEALEHLYENGVVHRDIKPANILIGKIGGARLADLGLAFAEDDPNMTGRGGTLGTPHYMSPEQAVDASRADARSDIWSFGATLFHAVCGVPPFSGTSAAEILSAVLYAPIPDPRSLTSELSKGLALILRKCLTRDPERRYATPGELLRDLERVRERRAPRVRRGGLDPVAGRERRRRWLWAVVPAGVAALSFLALGSGWFEQRFGGGAPRARAAEAFAPLEALAGRWRRQPHELAQHLGDLANLRPDLPEGSLLPWSELQGELRAALRDGVRAAQAEVEAALWRAVRAEDFLAAEALLAGGLEQRVAAHTGFGSAALAAEGIDLAPWRARQREALDAELLTAAGSFRDALEGWSSELNGLLDPLLQARRWGAAEDALDVGWTDLVQELGLGRMRLPEAQGRAFRQQFEATLRLQRDRVHDHWRATDETLAAFVRDRADQLEEELQSGGTPRIRAALKLRRAYDLELEELGVVREAFPSDAPATSLIVLERRADELLERESEWLEADARRDLAETVALCEDLWGARRYASIAELWDEVLEKQAFLAERVQDPWLPALRERAEAHRAEALLLQELVLERAAQRVVALNGKPLSKITVGKITLSDKRVKSGLFPLEDGFLVEGFEDPIHLRVLSYDQLRDLAGLGPGQALAARQELALAAFLHHEGQHEAARPLLRGEPRLEPPLDRLYWDLERRVSEAQGAQAKEEQDRQQRAGELLAYVFNAEHQAHSPQRVGMHIKSLLEDYGDLPEVREKARALRVLREARRATTKVSIKEALKREFRLEPPRIQFPGYKDVRMEFDFRTPPVGSWQSGDWDFDGAGLGPTARAEDWDDLVYQNGPRLNLPAPLKVDRFALTVELDEIEDGLPQLVVLSAAGFHVALIGPGLPGREPSYRLLVDSGRLDAFLERLRAGEGKPHEGTLLATHGMHRIELQGDRSTGFLKLRLDGRELWNDHCSPPRQATPHVQLLAWEMVRVRRVVLEAER